MLSGPLGPIRRPFCRYVYAAWPADRLGHARTMRPSATRTVGATRGNRRESRARHTYSYTRPDDWDCAQRGRGVTLDLVHVDFGAAWRTGPVLSLGRFDVADNRIHDAPDRQQLLALRGVQVLDSLGRQECPHEPVQAWEAEHHFVMRALGAEGVSFDGLGLGHTVIPFLVFDTRRNRAQIGHPDGHCPRTTSRLLLTGGLVWNVCLPPLAASCIDTP